MMYKFILFLILGFIVSAANSVASQSVGDQGIEELVNQLKNDVRGPYRDIRWFCPDGSVNPPREYCAEEGGIQHARYKLEVEQLAKSNHIFFGQILAGTDRDDFWDACNNNSRVKQYQLGNYLRRIDDGWIMRRGQYYRGAFQMQDEEAWGIDFMKRLLSKDHLLESKFYLIRQMAKDIAHKGENYQTEQVWAISKYIGDQVPEFLNIRIKIHGQPDVSDLIKVKDFYALHKNELNEHLRQKFDKLINYMEEVYQPANLKGLQKYVSKIKVGTPLRVSLDNYLETFSSIQDTPAKMMATAEKLWEIRIGILNQSSRTSRLALLDLSIALEEIFNLEITAWKTSRLDELMNKICYMGLATTATGLVEQWEWESIANQLAVPLTENFTLGELISFEKSAQRLVEWGSAMPRATYQDVVELYGSFEPLALGFFDERVHNSVLLHLGGTVGEMGNFVAREANLSNRVFDLQNQSSIYGLNPGYAQGKLVVVDEVPQSIKVESDKIYVFNHPPTDLQPVAGIATTSAGNLVSHIQLLARNHGIPNMVLARENLEELKNYDGEQVFMAVSYEGTVIMKLQTEMTVTERELFSKNKRVEKRVAVPMEKIDLELNRVINLNMLGASDAGISCGPKAANLGALKKMFPNKVVEGIVIPFGVFREHLDLQMPGQELSYWSFVNNTFMQAEKMRATQVAEDLVEIYVLEQLKILRAAIEMMPLKESFFEDLVAKFETAFGKPPGEVPVFVRSDTNMEDLQGFTGAGLNKTLFNVVDFAAIIDGIRAVWASPYSERSYKWRQHYLLNPENVFPSILIIPSVDVEYSGVVITKGITSNNYDDLTVALSRGAGGAVDGQAAESWLLSANNVNTLLAPARESGYRRLPTSGGTSKHRATYEERILSPENLNALRNLAYEVNEQLAFATDGTFMGPFDIELGFKDDGIWLFQIRPFVENKRALHSDYLASITPVIDLEKIVPGNTRIKFEKNILSGQAEALELQHFKNY